MQQWNDFVAEDADATLMQTTHWAQLRADFGWTWEVVMVDPDTPERGGALVYYKSLPLKLGTIAYIPRGPLVNWDDETAVQATLNVIQQAARRRWAWALWLEPPLRHMPTNEDKLRTFGFEPSERGMYSPRCTIWVDLTPTPDQILAQMKQKTRYNIRLAARKGVQIRIGQPAEVDTFYNLLQTTGERNDFRIFPQAYYRRAFSLFHPLGQVALLLAEVDGEVIAGLMVFAWGHKAWYLYGASTNQHREKMAPYALQWAAMQWAKAKGCTTYDLWGIPDASPAELEANFQHRHDGLWPVYRFKRGFGGDVVRFVGVWEKAFNPLYRYGMALWERRPGR